MNLTLFFGGTGHNIKTDSWEDKFISMFCKIDPKNYCAFHPGPGCQGSHIYANKSLHDLLPLKQKNQTYDIKQTKFGITAGMNKHDIKRIRTAGPSVKKNGGLHTKPTFGCLSCLMLMDPFGGRGGTKI
jgi:hypothetical protein